MTTDLTLPPTASPCVAFAARLIRRSFVDGVAQFRGIFSNRGDDERKNQRNIHFQQIRRSSVPISQRIRDHSLPPKRHTPAARPSTEPSAARRCAVRYLP